MKERFANIVQSGKTLLNKLQKHGILRGVRITYKVFWNLLLIFIVFGLMAVFFAGGVGAGYFASLVKEEEPRSYENMKNDIYNYEETSQIYFADNILLGNLRSDIERSEISLSEVSEFAKNAIIATEDNYFYEHQGIVPKALGRAIFQELTNSDTRTGGSTLTQQLVKNQILTREVSFDRKAKEILLALRLERFFDKDDILEAYLNIVPFGRNASGQNIAGIEAAAQGIFGVSAKELNLPQAAYIAGLPQNPYTYTPFNNDGSIKESLDASLTRMKTVLSRMLTEGYIDEQQYDKALAYDVKANLAEPKPTPQESYPAFNFEVERRAVNVLAKVFAEQDGHDSERMAANAIVYDNLDYESRYSGKPIEKIAEEKELDFQQIKDDYNLFNEYIDNADIEIRRGGYHIHTTIDKDIYDAWQKSKDDVLDNRNYFQAPKTVYVKDPETGEQVAKEYPMELGAMMIENKTGRIISFVGGRDFESQQLNHATQAYRPNGSTMKPLLDYAPAMEHGLIQPGYILVDAPLTEVSGWNPKNYGGGYKGLMTAREALRHSQNTPAARAFLRMDAYEATGYLEKMGFTSLVGTDRTNLAMSLGAMTRGVTVEENTNAFTTFANGGKFIDAYMIEKIISSEGEIVYEHESEPVDVFSPQTAYLTLDMLREVIYGGGTAGRLPSYLKFRADWFGKTGTTDDWEDSWFVGANPNVTIGVWTGYDRPMPLDRSNYAHRTQRIWALLANAAYDVDPELMNPGERFAMPSGIVRRSFCGITGLLPSDLCKEAGLVRTDLFNAKYVPNKVDDSLTEVRYVVMKGKSYQALDSTPEEFTKQGVNIKLENFQNLSLNQILPTGWENLERLVEEKAKENGKVPNPVPGVHINGGSLIWSEHGESDIVGYRIYRAANGSNDFKQVASIATFDNTTSFPLSSGEANAYYVTAVDVAGNESPPSRQVTVGNWTDNQPDGNDEQKNPDKREPEKRDENGNNNGDNDNKEKEENKDEPPAENSNENNNEDNNG